MIVINIVIDNDSDKYDVIFFFVKYNNIVVIIPWITNDNKIFVINRETS